MPQEICYERGILYEVQWGDDACLFPIGNRPRHEMLLVDSNVAVPGTNVGVLEGSGEKVPRGGVPKYHFGWLEISEGTTWRD